MTDWTAPKTWVPDEKLLSDDLNTHLRDNLLFLKSKIALGEAVELEITEGVVTKTQTFHFLSSEIGEEDDLDTINGGTEGDVLFLTAQAGHTITVTEIGNIIGTGTIDGDRFAILTYLSDRWVLLVVRSTEELQDLIDATMDDHTTEYNHDLLELLEGDIGGEAAFFRFNIPESCGIYFDSSDLTVWVQDKGHSVGAYTIQQLVPQGFNINGNKLQIYGL